MLSGSKILIRCCWHLKSMTAPTKRRQILKTPTEDFM